jgi:hypothetical protein
MLNKPEAEFADLYTQSLERRGIDYFAQRFADVARAACVDELILCCYEDLRMSALPGIGPATFCHRRIFAEYWEEQTGQVVQEIAEEDS